MWRLKRADIPTTAPTKIEAETNAALHTNFCSLRLHVINLHSTAGKINLSNPGLLSLTAVFYNLMSQSPNCMPDLGMSYIVIFGLATENVISWHVSGVYPVL